MFITNSTNRHPSYRWFLGDKSPRNPQKVHSLVYKDYTLVEYGNGTKSYVSPEEKARLLLDGKLKSSKLSLQNEKTRPGSKSRESDSDSGYEVPVSKSCEALDETPKPELKRNASLPFFTGEEVSPGDNGRINLPPYIVPLETSFTYPVTTRRKKDKKKNKRNGSESSSSDEITSNKWDESPEDAEVREITENRTQKTFSLPSSGDKFDGGPEARKAETELEGPVEVFPVFPDKRRFSHGFQFPRFPAESLKPREKRGKNAKMDPNPLRKMFGRKKTKKPGNDSEPEEKEERGAEEESAGRYGDAVLQSDTESADHGSADKSSTSKLTSEKQPKKLMSGLLGSFRMVGRNKDKVADNDAVRNPSSFEITVKEQSEDVGPTEVPRTEGIVYAELDMARSPGNVMRRDDEKTEYAEIIYPGSRRTFERATEELRKSRENLTSSRENLTEVDEAFSTTPDGKREAAV